MMNKSYFINKLIINIINTNTVINIIDKLILLIK